MTWDYESELAEKIELITEQFWLNGMSLSAARKKAVDEVIEKDIDEAIRVVPSQH